MSEMIERVARALYDMEWVGVDPKPEMAPSDVRYWTDNARAAITAMREPAAAMIDHFGDAMGDTPQAHEDARELWREAIDVALER